jgi:hypothetical protein
LYSVLGLTQVRGVADFLLLFFFGRSGVLSRPYFVHFSKTMHI